MVRICLTIWVIVNSLCIIFCYSIRILAFEPPHHFLKQGFYWQLRSMQNLVHLILIPPQIFSFKASGVYVFIFFNGGKAPAED